MSWPAIEIPKSLLYQTTEDRTDELRTVAKAIGTALSTYPHFVVVSGYPAIADRTNLVALCQSVGAIATHSINGNTKPSRPRKVSFTTVQIDPTKATAAGGVTQYSRTHLPLPPHTDSSYMARPHELVAFQCIASDQTGGNSIMLPVKDLLPQLDRSIVELMRSPVYPFGKHTYPLLVGESGHELMRYYQAQVEHSVTAETTALAAPYRAVLEALDSVLDQAYHSYQFHLQPGQIVLMHNHRVLHGRTGFEPGSDRLLYRVRLHVDSFGTAAGDQAEHRSEPTDARSFVYAPHQEWSSDTSDRRREPSRIATIEQNKLNTTELADMGDKQDTPLRTPVASPMLELATSLTAVAKTLEKSREFGDALDHHRQACQLAPQERSVIKAYGDCLLKTGRFADAAHIFERCLAIAPDDYESGLALSSLALAGGNSEAAQNLLKSVVQQHPYVPKHPADRHKPTLVRMRGLDGSAYKLMRRPDGTYKYLLRGGHFAIRDLVDRQRYNITVLNIFDNNVDELQTNPEADLLLNVIACPDGKRASLLTAARFVDRYPGLPIINHPRQVLETTRERNALRLNLISGVSFPKTEKFRWNGVSVEAAVKAIWGLGFTLPLIMRRVGTQTGSSVALIQQATALRSHLQNLPPQEDYYLIQFKDCRNEKGIFNKMRVFFIDGYLYPVANLFNDTWSVHSGDRYQVMAKTDWMQDSEKAYLQDPVGYLGQANVDKLYKICDVIGLDFFGIDLTVLPDGTLFIFELNAAMRHNFDHADNFPYTRPHLERISTAFDGMIQRRLA